MPLAVKRGRGVLRSIRIERFAVLRSVEGSEGSCEACASQTCTVPKVRRGEPLATGLPHAPQILGAGATRPCVRAESRWRIRGSASR